MSPARGPCGIPDELEPDDFEVVVGVDFFGVEVVAAAAGVLLAVVVDVGAGVLLLEEDDALLPQPAAMTPATANARKGTPRATLDLLIMTNLCCLSCWLVGTAIRKDMTLHTGEPFR
jgi:hypothetical protein